MTVTRRSALGFLSAAVAAAAPLPALAAIREAAPLRFENLHTGERLAVSHRRQGTLDRGALRAVDHFLRDWRTDAVHAIDPGLLDFVADVRARVGYRGDIQVISGYRSPATNASLARKSGGVAKRSLHMQGRAIDLAFGDLPARTVRDAALALDRGGVGIYSDLGFVHLDTGPTRTWGR